MIIAVRRRRFCLGFWSLSLWAEGVSENFDGWVTIRVDAWTWSTLHSRVHSRTETRPPSNCMLLLTNRKETINYSLLSRRWRVRLNNDNFFIATISSSTREEILFFPIFRLARPPKTKPKFSHPEPAKAAGKIHSGESFLMLPLLRCFFTYRGGLFRDDRTDTMLRMFYASSH